MKGIAKFLVRWAAAWITGAIVGTSVIVFGMSLVGESNWLILICIMGLLLAFLSARVVVGIINRWLEGRQ